MTWPQIKHISITYLTHRRVMAGVAGGLLLIVGLPIAFEGMIEEVQSERGAAHFLFVGMPVAVLSILLVIQAQAQFAHARARLIPGFVLPHLALLAALLFAVATLYPLLVATCYQIDPLSLLAFAVAIASLTLLSTYTMSGLALFGILATLVTITILLSPMTSFGATWWIHRADSHRAAQTAILVAGGCLVVAWLGRLAVLREEMRDYGSFLAQCAVDRSGAANALDRRKWTYDLDLFKSISSMDDRRLAQLPSGRGESPLQLARLLRFGFFAPVGLSMVMIVLLILATVLVASLILIGTGSTLFTKSNGAVALYLFMVSVPGCFTGGSLAEFRSRFAAELVLPLSRRRLVDGLLIATLWNVPIMWAALSFGLLPFAWLALGEKFTVPNTAALLAMSATSSVAMVGVELRTATWGSPIGRMIVFFLAFFGFLFLLWPYWWQPLVEVDHPGSFLVNTAILAPALVVVGAFFIWRARKVWQSIELG